MIRERLDDVNRQVGMICETVSRRLAPSRDDPPPRCEVGEVMEQVAGLCQGTVPVQAAVPDRMWAEVDPVQLGVALLCVVENAVQACAGRPRARVRLRCQSEALEEGEGERIALEVLDDGPGLYAEAEERACERFFSSKAGHAGLGLSVARTILGRWRGDLLLANRGEGESGVRAVLYLPAAPRPGTREKTEGG